MKNNRKLGIILSIIGLAAGLLIFYLLADQYNPVIDAQIASGRTDEGAAARITLAVLGWLGAAAGALWAPVLYGFVRRKPWAWFWGAVAATIQLLAGFFPAIPAMARDLPTPTLVVFGMALVLWFGMLLIGGVKGKIIVLTFVAGLAYVLTFIDGVAPIAKYTTSHDDPFWNGMYVMSQQVSWWGAAAFAAAMSMLAGYPLGLHNALAEVHRFSMFLPAPLISTGLLVTLLLPGPRRMLEEWGAS